MSLFSIFNPINFLVSAFEPKKAKILEQVVYDTTYLGTCPVCETSIEEDGHCIENNGKYSGLSHKLLVECSNCHAAFYADRQEVIKTLKKYVKDDHALLCLRLISEERIK